MPDLDIVPHQDNGRECGMPGCGARVHYTGTGWTSRAGGSHKPPAPREPRSTHVQPHDERPDTADAG